MTGEEFKEEREKLGYSQEELAVLMNKTRVTISRWENSDKIKKEHIVLLQTLSHNVSRKKVNQDSVNENDLIYNTNGNSYKGKSDGTYEVKADIIPFSAYGSYLEHLEGGVAPADYESAVFNVDRIGRGNYKAFRIKGDSMNGDKLNDTPDGALVLGREIGRHLWQDGFHDHKYGCIILSKDNIYHKDISGFNPESGEILCKSRNELFKPFTLFLNDVYQIFKVIKRTF